MYYLHHKDLKPLIWAGSVLMQVKYDISIYCHEHDLSTTVQVQCPLSQDPFGEIKLLKSFLERGWPGQTVLKMLWILNAPLPSSIMFFECQT